MNRRVALLLSLVVPPAVGACATMNVAPQTTQAQPAGLEVQIAAYVEIQEALADDDFDVARTHLEAFARAYREQGSEVPCNQTGLEEDRETARRH